MVAGQAEIIAALYVDARGVYAKYRCIDLWPKARDARGYNGPLAVVAHPPCQLWGNLAALNYARWGGAHNAPGNDGGCFAHAALSVLRFGGVLEHPAGSKAFSAYGLPAPSGTGWNRHGERVWVCEVWQSAYGHKARKRTWLLYSGARAPFDLEWARRPGTHQVGQGWAPKKPVLSKREANATPVAFAEALIALAVTSYGLK